MAWSILPAGELGGINVTYAKSIQFCLQGTVLPAGKKGTAHFAIGGIK